MNTSDSTDAAPRGGYSSVLRTRQKEQTRDLILRSVSTLLSRTDLGAVTIAEVARVAEVTERTIYRHFSTREELLSAFWQWQLERSGGRTVTRPATMEALMDNIRLLFTSLDADEGVIRAVLSATEGREIRRTANAERLEHMLAFLQPLVPDLPEQDRHSLAAGVISVCSVMSWLFMRDNCGYDGARAGEAAAYAVRMMIEGAQRAPTASATAENPARIG